MKDIIVELTKIREGLLHAVECRDGILVGHQVIKIDKLINHLSEKLNERIFSSDDKEFCKCKKSVISMMDTGGYMECAMCGLPLQNS